MTVVKCLMGECRDWLNGTCSRRKIKVVGTRCIDFNRRRSQYKNVTTTVQCINEGCSSFRNGVCVKDVLVMKGDGCYWKINVTEK